MAAHNAKTTRNELIVQRYLEANETLEQIGEAFGITRERVRQITRSAGVTREMQATARQIAHYERLAASRPITKGNVRPELKLAVDLVRQGLSYGAAAKQTNVTRNAVAGACFRAGLKTGRPVTMAGERRR